MKNSKSHRKEPQKRKQTKEARTQRKGSQFGKTKSIKKVKKESISRKRNPRVKQIDYQENSDSDRRLNFQEQPLQLEVSDQKITELLEKGAEIKQSFAHKRKEQQKGIMKGFRKQVKEVLGAEEIKQYEQKFKGLDFNSLFTSLAIGCSKLQNQQKRMWESRANQNEYKRIANEQKRALNQLLFHKKSKRWSFQQYKSFIEDYKKCEAIIKENWHFGLGQKMMKLSQQFQGKFTKFKGFISSSSVASMQKT